MAFEIGADPELALQRATPEIAEAQATDDLTTLAASDEARKREAAQVETDLIALSTSRRINEQCFLFDSLEFFAGLNTGSRYKHIIPVIGDPSTAPSRLTRTKAENQDLFFQLKLTFST